MSDIDMKYAALRNKVAVLPPNDPKYKEIHDYTINSQVGPKCIRIKNIFSVEREIEVKEFRSHLHNIKLLFHGSNGTSLERVVCFH